jgi:hypothetical protein
MGEIITGMACAIVDPVKSVRMFLTRPEFAESFLNIKLF